MVYGESMIFLVCGPSSVGKSTYVQTAEALSAFGLETKPPLVFPDEVGVRDLPSQPYAVHYNILRPVHSLEDQGGLASANARWSYDFDQAWQRIVKLPGPKKAIVLVASVEDLKARAAVRTAIEPELHAVPHPYPNEYWSKIYQKLDLRLVYQIFVAQLQELGIETEFVLSRDGTFTSLQSEEIYETLEGQRSKYTRERIAEIIKSPIFEYQQVPLPFGLSTRGQDRSGTVSACLPEDLSGCSVLDVGSALGLFCFEAERRRASHVVGLEPRQTRFEAAIILKEILGSRVEFRRQSLLDYSPGELFDRVLLLNVIHHMKEPMQSLRRCAESPVMPLSWSSPTQRSHLRQGLRWLYERPERIAPHRRKLHGRRSDVRLYSQSARAHSDGS